MLHDGSAGFAVSLSFCTGHKTFCVFPAETQDKQERQMAFRVFSGREIGQARRAAVQDTRSRKNG